MSVTPLRLDEPPRLPPRNVEAEQALLGALLRDDRAYASVADIVRREDFSLGVHGRTFAVIGNVIAHGTEANSTMLRHIFDGDAPCGSVEAAHTSADSPNRPSRSAMPPITPESSSTWRVGVTASLP